MKLYIAIAVLATSLFSSSVVAASVPADSIFINGHFYTPAGWKTAVAIRRGVLVAVGDQAEMDKLRSASTKVTDLNGATVLPGLQDNHIHPMAGGLLETQCKFPGTSTPEQILAALRSCVVKAKPGEWIRGGTYQALLFGKNPPDRSMLDTVSPNNPVHFNDIGGHNSWANSMAFKLAGVTKDTPDPKNGRIVRRPDGEPSGILNETARSVLSGVIPPPSAEARELALTAVQKELLGYGVTEITDALADTSSLETFAAMSDKGSLKLRVTECVSYASGAVPMRNLYSRDRLNPSCVKLIVDGVPSNSQTAAMIEPYDRRDPTRPSEYAGALMIPQDQLNELIAKLDREGFSVKVHAIGDAATREVINAVAYTRAKNGTAGPIHTIAHASFMKLEDVARVKSLGLAMEISPYSLYHAPMTDEIEMNVGKMRMERWKPIRDYLNAGILSATGSDWPTGPPTPDPWIEMETLVTRQVVGGNGPTLGESQKVSLAEALRLFTEDGARVSGTRTRLGAIEVGMLADLIVLDRDPFAIPATDIHNVKVNRTIIAGETVYQRP